MTSPDESKSHGTAGDVFSRLDGPSETVHVQTRTKVRLLPETHGTYALLDRFGSVLYIGKAANLRARVRSHLVDHRPFRGRPDWRKKIDRIETRVAFSECEALLVEADLVRRLRPGFNRQMRSWQRYCYLVQNDSALNPLSVSLQSCPWKLCFGPYRSRRQAVRIIEAVFHLMRLDPKGKDLRDRVAGLLSGRDATLLYCMRQHLMRMERRPAEVGDARLLRGSVDAIENAYDRGVMLSRAESLLNALLLLPGPGETRTAAVIAGDGLRIDRLHPNIAGVGTLLQRYRELAECMPIASIRPLPKSIADGLCVAAQQCQRFPHLCRAIPAEVVISTSPERFLALATE